MRRASCLVSPIPDHAFFEQSQFEGLLGDNFLEVLRFAPKLLDLVGRRRTSSVPGKPTLAGLEKLLRPGVIHALGNAFAPAKLGDRGFAAKAIEHDADLLFRPMVLPSCASDVADNAFRRRGHGLGFLSHLRSLAATMSQKSSLPQAASFVSQVLKRDIARIHRSIFQDARFQPTPDQADQARIAYSMFDKPEDPIMIETPEEVLQVRLQHPASHAAADDLVEGRQGVMGTELWPAAERAGQEVLLVNSGQHLSRGALERPVGDSWHPEGALLRLTGLGDID